jgi:hypothetical protein
MLWHTNDVLVFGICVCLVCSFWVVGWPVVFFSFEESRADGLQTVPARR